MNSNQKSSHNFKQLGFLKHGITQFAWVLNEYMVSKRTLLYTSVSMNVTTCYASSKELLAYFEKLHLSYVCDVFFNVFVCQYVCSSKIVNQHQKLFSQKQIYHAALNLELFWLLHSYQIYLIVVCFILPLQYYPNPPKPIRQGV